MMTMTIKKIDLECDHEGHHYHDCEKRAYIDNKKMSRKKEKIVL